MFETVAIPVWALILIALFAAISILERVIGPSIRWFFRKRAERVVAELNKRLDRPIEPFRLARRYDMIQRLKFDPEVAQAITDHARDRGIPEAVAFKQAERYAREIVPSFSASAYFGIGTRLARWVSTALFHVRLGPRAQEHLQQISPEATVVFVMNHRSNMDYLLVTWLAADRSALSYAVGEWARVWPLSSLIRTMGAFFIRRRSLNPLYRKVLARYVQLATQGGVTQAVFPEGRLSLDGRMAEPKLGFLSYIVSGFQPGGRDVVFVPVALNYDRVLEDRVLIEADRTGVRRFRASIPTAIAFAFRQTLRRLRGRFRKFGNAAVAFGEPLSLSEFAKHNPASTTEALGAALKQRINAIIPVLPVPLIAFVLNDHDAPMPEADLMSSCKSRLKELEEIGADILLPTPTDKALQSALTHLTQRRIIEDKGQGWQPVASETATLTFYANSIRDIVATTKRQR